MNKTILYIGGALLALIIFEKFSARQPVSTVGIPNTLLYGNPTGQNVAIGVAAGTSILSSLKNLFGGSSSGPSVNSSIPAGAGTSTDSLGTDFFNQFN